jgi:branched-chain amino acid transport system substrate-binding protein
MDYTGSSALEGQEVWKGAALAFDQANAAGGVNGHKITMVLGDNQCDPSIGITAIRSLFAANVDAIIGSNCSSVTEAQMPLLKTAKIPMLSVEDTAPAITQDAGVGGNIWEFRLNDSDALMDSAFATDYVAKQVKSVAIVATESDYGTAVVNAMQSNLPGEGVTITSVDYVPLQQTDFTSLISKIQSEHPEGILIAFDYPQGGPFINQMNELGYTDVKLFARADEADPALIPLLGNKTWADGLVAADFWSPEMPGASSIDAAFKAKYGQTIDRPAGVGYLGATVLMDAIRMIKGTVTPTAIQQALSGLHVDVPTLGEISFDSHNQAHYPMVILGIENAQVVYVKSVPVG